MNQSVESSTATTLAGDIIIDAAPGGDVVDGSGLGGSGGSVVIVTTAGVFHVLGSVTIRGATSGGY
jgi:hypothetical protein